MINYQQTQENFAYEKVSERVRKIRKFYISVAVFLAVFGIVYGIRFFKFGFLNLQNFINISIMFTVWALVLAVKGIKLFIFNSGWENRKIKELEEKYS
jgi:hypothetical protein